MMPYRQKLTEWVAIITAFVIGLKFTWTYIIVPAWKRWKDYELRGDQIDKLLIYSEDRKVENSFILEKLHIAWFKSDINGYTTECSSLACTMLETKTEEVIGQNWTSFIVEEDKPRVLNELNDCIEHRKTFKCVYKTYTATGKIIVMKSHAKLTEYGWFGTLEII
jgi:PAS domain S-box-containing protein